MLEYRKTQMYRKRPWRDGKRRICHKKKSKTISIFQTTGLRAMLEAQNKNEKLTFCSIGTTMYSSKLSQNANVNMGHQDDLRPTRFQIHYNSLKYK